MQRQPALSRVEPARRSAVAERNASGSEVSQHHGGISGPSRRADDGRRVALAQSHGRPLPPLQPPRPRLCSGSPCRAPGSGGPRAAEAFASRCKPGASACQPPGESRPSSQPDNPSYPLHYPHQSTPNPNPPRRELTHLSAFIFMSWGRAGVGWPRVPIAWAAAPRVRLTNARSQNNIPEEAKVLLCLSVLSVLK